MFELDRFCAAIILVVYFAFGLGGIAIEHALSRYTVGLQKPFEETHISSSRGRQLFRWNRAWEAIKIPVWIGTFGLAWLLCT